MICSEFEVTEDPDEAVDPVVPDAPDPVLTRQQIMIALGVVGLGAAGLVLQSGNKNDKV